MLVSRILEEIEQEHEIFIGDFINRPLVEVIKFPNGPWNVCTGISVYQVLMEKLKDTHKIINPDNKVIFIQDGRFRIIMDTRKNIIKIAKM